MALWTEPWNQLVQCQPQHSKTECRRMGLGLRANGSMVGTGRGVGGGMELSCINVRFSVPKPAPQPSHLHHRALWVEESSLAPEEVRHSRFALGSSICFCWTCTLGQKVQGAGPRLEYYVSVLFSLCFSTQTGRVPHFTRETACSMTQ